MKIFLLILLMMPIIGMAQLEKMSGQAIQPKFLFVPPVINEIENRQPFTIDTNKKRRITSVLNANTYNTILLDSLHFTFYTSTISRDSSFTRTCYNYDSIGHISNEYKYSIQYSNSRAEISRTDYEFDALGQMIQIAQYSYINDKYILVRKTERKYDLSGKLIQENSINSTENASGQIINFSKEESIYEGYTQVYVRYLWDPTKNEWVFNMKVNNTFDENWKGVSQEWFNYYNNRWVGDQKLEIFYDNNKNAALELYLKWNDISGQWENSQQIGYTYDPNGKQVQRMISFWNNKKNRWIENEKVDRNYTSSGKIFSISTFKADTTGQWTGVKKEEYSYTNKGNVAVEQFFYWDDLENQWILQAKYDYEFNAENEITHFTYSWWNNTSNQWTPSSRMDYSYSPSKTSIIRSGIPWYSTNNQWMIESKEERFYSNHTLSDGRTEPDRKALTIFPNPFYEFFYIENNDTTVTQFQLFNSSGQLIQTMPVMQGVTKYIFSDLKVGLYMIKIKTGQGIKVMKMIKR